MQGKTPQICGMRSRSFRTPLVLIVLLAAMGLPVTCRNTDAAPNVGTRGKEMLQSHAATKESIRSFECRVRIVAETRLPSAMSREYVGRHWQDFDKVRVDSGSSSQSDTSILRDNVVDLFQRILEGGATKTGASRRRHDWTELGKCDASVGMLLRVNVPETSEYVPVDQLVARASKCSVAESGRLFQLRFDREPPRKNSWEVKVRFEPKANDLVKSIEYRFTSADGKTVFREYDVQQFAEVAPSVHLPSRVIARSSIDGTDWTHQVAEFTEIKVNEGVVDRTFRLPLPNRVVMTDEIRRTYYWVDSEGNRTSAETKTSSDLAVVAGTAGQSGGGNDSTPPERLTTREPISWTRLVLPISLVLAIVLLAVAVAGTLRKR